MTKAFHRTDPGHPDRGADVASVTEVPFLAPVVLAATIKVGERDLQGNLEVTGWPATLTFERHSGA
jgi:hypothetical protein